MADWLDHFINSWWGGWVCGIGCGLWIGEWAQRKLRKWNHQLEQDGD